MPEKTEIATLAGGCFWCTEAVFDQIPGVLRADSGYTGGQTENPTYRQVCTGKTGHAEALEIEYDPSRISFEQLLDVFWKAHDPTQINRQGNDIGTQYRSAIFYHNEAQRKAAETSIAALNAAGTYSNPVVTEVVPATTFYKAEAYMQEYYVNNRNQGYCQFVIKPKLKKLGLNH
ncbi:MAG: peptide-methionine (S)-S-oxide reductase MsrA [Kiritimatiellae bacterium]|nr:peptide-methionine (S)-S-oxide reductase MsrA [Kiritimatiellia bacterium]